MASATMQNDLNMRLQRTAPSGNGSTRTLWSMGKAGAPHTNRGVRSDTTSRRVEFVHTFCEFLL